MMGRGRRPCKEQPAAQLESAECVRPVAKLFSIRSSRPGNGTNGQEGGKGDGCRPWNSPKGQVNQQQD